MGYVRVSRWTGGVSRRGYGMSGRGLMVGGRRMVLSRRGMVVYSIRLMDGISNRWTGYGVDGRC